MSVRARKPIALTLATALVAGLLMVLQNTVAVQPAQAAPVIGFDPGMILSDALMYDSGTMNSAAVQAFLDSRGAACTPAAGNTCVRDYRESTPNRAGDSLCPAAYTGVPNETAASIIVKVSAACGINPQVLLVTLQKEQGLITSTTGKSAYTYSRALGFGCPDNVGGWCNPEYAGFANQVYSAAKQLKNYAANPTRYSYRAGRVNTILWNPDTACGSTQVYIQNQATASLYNYTPYAPNAAAIAAGYGSGDACSSYGNRNFYLYFTAWFGANTQRPPTGVVEMIRAGGTGTIEVSGWAFDPDAVTSIDVHFYVDGVGAKAVTASAARPDVLAAYGKGANSGYGTSLTVASGAHTVCVYAIDSAGGTNTLLSCHQVVVVNNAPVGVIEMAGAAGPGQIVVSGWAFDPDTAAPVDVHVYVDGVGAGATTASHARPDVAAGYRRGPEAGYSVTVPVRGGNQTVCVYAIDASGGLNSLLGCRAVTVVNNRPVGTVESVRSLGGGTVQISGWAFDPDTTSPASVHVYVDGAGVLATTADLARADVASAYRRGPEAGYVASVQVSDGPHTVCAYAIDTSGGVASMLGCSSVVAANRAPVGTIDYLASPAPGSVTVQGWAFDPDSMDPIGVHLYLDGAGVLATTASGSRPDVAAVYGQGPNHGFSATIEARAGNHTVCAYGIDTTGGRNPMIGCSTVTVANSPAVGALETVTAVLAPGGGVRSSVKVTGWAWDFDTTTPVSVRGMVDGVVAGTATATEAHAPVPGVTRTNIGVTMALPTTPGVHEVCLEVLDSPGGSPVRVGCSTVDVPNAAPMGIIEFAAGTAASGATPAQITVAGWTMDADTSAPLTVHVYVDGAVAGGTTSAHERPDVAAVYKNGSSRGFSLAVPATPGSRRVCVYALNAPDGPAALLECRTVIVP